MLMFIQPFGLETPGGGARILRSLVEGRSEQFVSVATGSRRPPLTKLGRELHLPARPSLGRIDSTRLAPYADWLARAAYRVSFRIRLRRLIRNIKPTAIHAIAHSTDFWDSFLVAQEASIPYTLTVHDELAYNMRRNPGLRRTQRQLGIAWQHAHRRIVICGEMGHEYCQRFGKREFDVVTDSLACIPENPHCRTNGRLNIYFMGSLHLSYHLNFDVLSRAAGASNAGQREQTVMLTCRGSAFPPPEDGLPFHIKPWSDETAVACDLEEADLLYFPLPFESQYEPFVRFSLSTKLVTYLGSGLPILYHGPRYAAAARLLTKHQAALIVSDPSIQALEVALHDTTVEQRSEFAANALDLARSNFRQKNVCRLFWHSYTDTAMVGVSSQRRESIISDVVPVEL